MAYGIDTEASMSQFIEILVAVADDFDSQPQNGWLKGYLQNPKVPAADKAAYVHRQLLRAEE